MPVLISFQAAHPDVVVRYLTDDRVFRLEYGEAHVAIRAGPRPKSRTTWCSPSARQTIALYATQSLYRRHTACPTESDGLARHRFVAHDNPDSRAPFYRWLRAHVPPTA